MRDDTEPCLALGRALSVVVVEEDKGALPPVPCTQGDFLIEGVSGTGSIQSLWIRGALAVVAGLASEGNGGFGDEGDDKGVDDARLDPKRDIYGDEGDDKDGVTGKAVEVYRLVLDRTLDALADSVKFTLGLLAVVVLADREGSFFGTDGRSAAAEYDLLTVASLTSSVATRGVDLAKGASCTAIDDKFVVLFALGETQARLTISRAMSHSTLMALMYSASAILRAISFTSSSTGEIWSLKDAKGRGDEASKGWRDDGDEEGAPE
ncbi:hypothetical protein BG000_006098, partial [Podila horticola]